MLNPQSEQNKNHIVVKDKDFLSPEEIQSIDDKALEWIVLLTSGDATAEDIKKCRQWRRTSSTNEYAFQKARNLWLILGQSDQLQIIDMEIIEGLPSFPTKFHKVIYLAKYTIITYRYILAVVFALACFGTAMINNHYDYSTDFGEINTVNLEDGSQITLNTNSALDLKFSSQKREVILDKGEVYFKVSHDTNRPFIVKSGNSLITVHGTKFSVKRIKDQIIVVVIEGHVKVSNQSMAIKDLTSNQQVKINDNAPFTVENVNALQVLSWREGMLKFPNTSLQDVLYTVQEYDKRKWIIYMDKSTKKTMLNTTVNIKDIDAWMEGITAALPIKIKHFGPFLILYS